jgi:hypothetical protein
MCIGFPRLSSDRADACCRRAFAPRDVFTSLRKYGSRSSDHGRSDQPALLLDGGSHLPSLTASSHAVGHLHRSPLGCQRPCATYAPEDAASEFQEARSRAGRNMSAREASRDLRGTRRTLPARPTSSKNLVRMSGKHMEQRRRCARHFCGQPEDRNRAGVAQKMAGVMEGWGASTPEHDARVVSRRVW